MFDITLDEKPILSMGKEKFLLCHENLVWIGPNSYRERRIVCAANKYFDVKEQKEFVIPCVRHSSPDLRELTHRFFDNGIIESYYTIEQGFIDQYSNYWTREQAYIIADNAKQINVDRNGSTSSLFSEGLY